MDINICIYNYIYIYHTKYSYWVYKTINYNYGSSLLIISVFFVGFTGYQLGF
jgi:hypothetical protein